VLSWRDAGTLARRGVTRRLGRAALTVLAVALASTLLVGLLAVAGTARTRVLAQLSKGGPLAGIKVAAAAPDLTQLAQDNAPPGRPKSLGNDALRRIEALPDVASVVPVRSAPVLTLATRPAGIPVPAGTPALTGALASGQETQFTDDLVGVDPRQVIDLPITVLDGRLPIAGHGEVAVTQGYLQRLSIGTASAAKLLGTEITVGAPQLVHLGKDIRVRSRWRRLTIVGVITQEATTAGNLLTDSAEVEADRQWSLAGQSVPDFPRPTSPYAGLFLIATVERYLHVVEIVLSGIGIIALVIASLGIANALLAAVRERRREIGVLKAIGARDVDILRIFLLEAGVLGLLGGLLGTAAGYAVAALVAEVVSGYLRGQGLVGVSPSVPGLVIAGGIIGSGLLALLAGIVPAMRAAGLPAREAVGS
jgi:putative ABC transport system permease protein